MAWLVARIMGARQSSDAVVDLSVKVEETVKIEQPVNDEKPLPAACARVAPFKMYVVILLATITSTACGAEKAKTNATKPGSV